MKAKIFSFITALSIAFSSFLFPFFSVNASAEQAVIPWGPIFEFIAETLGWYAINKGADYAVDQLTGSGRKMTDDELNSASKEWENCKKHMKSQGCSDSDIQKLQDQIQGGNLDLSSPTGQALQDYFASKGANNEGAWNDFIIQNADILDGYYRCPSEWDIESVRSWLRGFVLSPSNKAQWGNINVGDVVIEDKYCKQFVGNIPCFCGTFNNTNFYGEEYTVGYYRSSDYTFQYVGSVSLEQHGSKLYLYTALSPYRSAEIIYASNFVKDDMQKSGINGNFSSIYSDKEIVDTRPIIGKTPTRISCNGGNVPHYFDNTIDNDDSSKNNYDTIPATIDWSKIFDLADDKNPIFKKIDGYKPPHPKIIKDGSNYDDVVKQLKEANRKLAKILGWLESFDYDNSGKIKDYRLSPIMPDTPLFNFKLSEKFPFSLPWDMLAILSILKADPIAPKYEFPILMPDESGKVKSIKLSDSRTGVIQGDKIVLDFTNQDMQDAAKILRWGELVLFILGLCVVFWKYGK